MILFCFICLCFVFCYCISDSLPDYYVVSNAEYILYDDPCVAGGVESNKKLFSMLVIILEWVTCRGGGDVYGRLYDGVYVNRGDLVKRVFFDPLYFQEHMRTVLQPFSFSEYKFGKCARVTYGEGGRSAFLLSHYRPIVRWLQLQSFSLDQLFFVTQMSIQSNSFERWEEIVYYDDDDVDDCNPNELDKNTYIGRGPLFLKGKCMYENCNGDLNLNLIENPYQVSHPSIGFYTSGWLWDKHYLLKKTTVSNDDLISYGFSNSIIDLFDQTSDVMLSLGFSKITKEMRRYHFLNCFAHFFFHRGRHVGCPSPFGCGNTTVNF